MSRIEDMTAELVRETQQWLGNAHVGELTVVRDTLDWLRNAPREEIRRVRGYVKPNPVDNVAMYEAGQAHSACPDDCEGCLCPVGMAPCGHCVDHEPLLPCGCPAYQTDEHGHAVSCTLSATGGQA